MRTKSMERESILGLMAENIKEAGKITTCTGLEHTHGKTDENTKVNTTWIKSMGMEFIFGLTVDVMRVIGLMANNTAKVNTSYQMVQLKLEFGKKESE